MNARKFAGIAGWSLALVSLVWTCAWAYVNNWAGDYPADWVYVFRAFHEPLWRLLPDFEPPSLSMIIGVVFALGIYFLPAYIANQRRAPNLPAIAGLNLFLGWTLLGWIAALGWAICDRREG
jgi:hypothetical protein